MRNRRRKKKILEWKKSYKTLFQLTPFLQSIQNVKTDLLESRNKKREKWIEANVAVEKNPLENGQNSVEKFGFGFERYRDVILEHLFVPSTYSSIEYVRSIQLQFNFICKTSITKLLPFWLLLLVRYDHRLYSGLEKVWEIFFRVLCENGKDDLVHAPMQKGDDFGRKEGWVGV